MIHLLSLAGKRALAELVATEPVLAFTFDGTLAPPVVLPSQARMQPALERCFRDLCALLPVAVITGRSLDDVEARLPVRPAYLVGNHGSGCLPGQAARTMITNQIGGTYGQARLDVVQAAAGDDGDRQQRAQVAEAAFQRRLHARLAGQHDGRRQGAVEGESQYRLGRDQFRERAFAGE